MHLGFFSSLRLKQMESEKLKNTGDSNNFMESRKALNTDLNSSVDEHISRLVEERDTLLRTGVYTTQDKIIVELDRQIRDAIAQRNRWCENVDAVYKCKNCDKKVALYCRQ